MQSEILEKVAEFIRNPEVRKRVDSPLPVQAPQDALTLSPESKRMQATMAGVFTDWEKKRLEGAYAVEVQVKAGRYKMSPEMVDRIASAIVKVL